MQLQTGVGGVQVYMQNAGYINVPPSIEAACNYRHNEGILQLLNLQSELLNCQEEKDRLFEQCAGGHAGRGTGGLENRGQGFLGQSSAHEGNNLSCP